MPPLAFLSMLFEPYAPMWLTLDIGNSAIKGGMFDQHQIVDFWRCPYAEWNAQWRERLVTQSQECTRIGISSVVPDRTRELTTLFGDLPVLHVNHRLQLPFALGYKTPGTLGADRLAAATAAWHIYVATPRDILVLDAGTTITYTVISRDGVLRGGAIGCGPALLGHALTDGTAQLPLVAPQLPSTVIGTSTEEALQIGILVSYVDQVRGMIARIQDALKDRPIIVATGGWHGFLLEHASSIDHADPFLVLRGINLLMSQNLPRP